MNDGSDAVLIRPSPGRDIIDVTSSQRGIELRIVATDPGHNGDYLRNIRMVTAATVPAAKAGQVFQNFRTVRFMDWYQTSASSVASRA